MALSGSNILIKLELVFFLIYILKLKLYSLFTSLDLSFKKCCSIRNYNFSLIEKQDGVPEQVESVLGDAVSNVASDLYIHRYTFLCLLIYLKYMFLTDLVGCSDN